MKIVFLICCRLPSVKDQMRKITLVRYCFTLAISLFGPLLATAENPHWIWHDNKGVAIQTNEVRYFRKTFVLDHKPTKAPLSVAADDEAVVYINGKQVAH